MWLSLSVRGIVGYHRAEEGCGLGTTRNSRSRGDVAGMSFLGSVRSSTLARILADDLLDCKGKSFATGRV